MPDNRDIYGYVLAMRALLRAEGDDLRPVNEEAKQMEADHLRHSPKSEVMETKP